MLIPTFARAVHFRPRSPRYFTWSGDRIVGLLVKTNSDLGDRGALVLSRRRKSKLGMCFLPVAEIRKEINADNEGLRRTNMA